MTNPFRYFKTSPEIIRLAVMMYIRFPLSLRNVEVLLQERGIKICFDAVRSLAPRATASPVVRFCLTAPRAHQSWVRTHCRAPRRAMART